ncbi:MAG: hypothetical protein ACOC9O_03630 [Myxococcota bacterium]
MGVAASLLAVSAVALASTGPRWPTRLGAALPGFGALACAAHLHGWLRGTLVAFVLAMTVASVLVLVLPPRPRWSRPLALATGVLGAAAGALHLAGGMP